MSRHRFSYAGYRFLWYRRWFRTRMRLVGLRKRYRLGLSHMLDHEDLKWVAASSTNLNSMLQQIARYTDLARRHPDVPNYINLVSERVDLATRTAQALFDRVTGNILETTAVRAANRRKGPTAPFTVLPPPTPMRSTNPMATDLSKLTPTNPSSSSSSTVAATDDVRIMNANGKGELVLIIEDENEVAELAAAMLANEDYKVILANDGFEALRIYQSVGKRIGLVILDFFLPVMDGDAVFDELRALNPDVNVVLSSGFAEQQKISSMLTQGLRGFIPKPYTRERLLEQVRSTLDAARQPARS
jgi:CheY-like chemotaxis protein